MLTKGDDYPLHQTPEPIAWSGSDRNFYDRYFFNGYSADGSLFFAAAMGIYPHLDIIDASFCVMVDGMQHNVRASRHLGSERLDLQVGPIRIEIVEPLQKLRITVSEADGPITADLTFDARHAPIEEPRFTRRNGPRMFMDYTRMTQNGGWSGTISIDGTAHSLSPDAYLGTRDRSWGIRPVGTADSQPPPSGNLPQFYWLWTPLNFDGQASFFHSNDDGEGAPWNRRAVVAATDGSAAEDFDDVVYDIRYRPGTRRVERMQAFLCNDRDIEIIVEPSGPVFHMSGLGYMHPEWGHGMDHGGERAAYDTIEAASADPMNPLFLHIQAFTTATLRLDGKDQQGHGVLEQMFIGPHATSGLTGLFDPHR